VILLDTSGMLAALDASEPRHAASAEALRAADGPRLLSPFVLAELDDLLATRVSPTAARRFLEEVANGAYELVAFDRGDVARATEILDRYGDLAGLADASIVVLAERYAIRDVLTLDERHFSVVAGRDGRPFRLLPADA
jgi:predicted nucleic acid-binding protein